jgi:transcriptional regulator with XRE-family HTH domain
MNFNEKLIELRKSKGLSQDELGQKIGVSRQTISKWELAQSYPDFQRLVLLSDYFGLSLDALVKDIDVQDVRDKNLNDKQLSAIYDDVQNAKSVISTVVNAFCVIGIVGVVFFLLVGIFLN